MWQLWRNADVPYDLAGIDPVLDSWNRRDDPAQVRLRTYLSALMKRVGPLPTDRPLYLSLLVDVKIPDHLFRFHDLENYLFPLFRTGAFRPAQFRLVSGMKKLGGGSALQIGVATRMDEGERLGWTHHLCSPGSGTQTKAWKERIHDSLVSAAFSLLRDGPAAMHLCLARCVPPTLDLAVETDRRCDGTRPRRDTTLQPPGRSHCRASSSLGAG